MCLLHQKPLLDLSQGKETSRITSDQKQCTGLMSLPSHGLLKDVKGGSSMALKKKKHSEKE
jgi:hypothetical protein